MDKQNNVMIGEGQSTSIKEVSLKKTPRRSSYNKSVTGIFVTRLEPATSAAQVAIFIVRETGLTVRPEKLRTKSENTALFI